MGTVPSKENKLLPELEDMELIKQDIHYSIYEKKDK